MGEEHSGRRSGETPEGRYANYFEVGHNAFEFVLDFGQLYADDDTVHLHTRIVTNPNYAKALLKILGESIGRYEQTFGTIPNGDDRPARPSG